MWKCLRHSFCQPVSGFPTPGFAETGRKRRFVGGYFQVGVLVFVMFHLSLDFRRSERLNHLI